MRTSEVAGQVEVPSILDDACSSVLLPPQTRADVPDSSWPSTCPIWLLNLKYLTDSCGSSARALWRPGRGVGVGTPERKGVRVYVPLMHFAVPQKLPQRCEADTLQKPNETFLLETGNVGWEHH